MSELEVDKWLHPGTLELHDNKDRNRQHHRLNKQRRTGNDCLQPFSADFGMKCRI